MFGAYGRSVLYAAFGALFAAVFSKIMTPFIDIMRNSPGAKGSQLLAGFVAINDNTLIIIIFGIVMGLIARAVVESRPGVGP